MRRYKKHHGNAIPKNHVHVNYQQSNKGIQYNVLIVIQIIKTKPYEMLFYQKRNVALKLILKYQIDFLNLRHSIEKLPTRENYRDCFIILQK